MSKAFRSYTPEQSELLPPSPESGYPKDIAYFILDTVKELNLKPLLSRYERELRGYPLHHPQMLVALLLYAYCVGVASSRLIKKKTYKDEAFRVIADGQHPVHTTISLPSDGRKDWRGRQAARHRTRGGSRGAIHVQREQ